MLKIFKYTLEMAASQVLQLPLGAQPLSVQEQQGQLQLWALVNPYAATRSYQVSMIGTGQQVDYYTAGVEFLGTVQFHGGDYVYHFFGVAL